MADPFFDSLNKSIDNLVPLAMKKWEIDRAADQFKQEMGVKNQVLDMEKQKFQQEVDKITETNRVKESLRKIFAPQQVVSPDKSALESTAAMPPDLIPSLTTVQQPNVNNLREKLSTLVGETGSPDALKLLLEAEKAKDPNKVMPTNSIVMYVNPKDPTQTVPVNVGLGQNAPPGFQPVDVFKATQEKPAKEDWSEPYTIQVAGKPVTVRKNLVNNKVEKIAEDVSTTVRVSQTGNLTEKDIIMPQIRLLPKQKAAAQESARRVTLYQDLSKMAESGAGGLVPGLKGMLSPVLEALGMDSKIESEAQAYQLMARAGVGSMRLMLVGSGQVSNYEQDLMQRLSGGSIKTSREAAKLLFKYYATESKKVVDDYNQTVSDISEVDPAIGKVYKPIKYTTSTAKEKRTIVEQRKTKDGRILTKYSDGSIE